MVEVVFSLGCYLGDTDSVGLELEQVRFGDGILREAQIGVIDKSKVQTEDGKDGTLGYTSMQLTPGEKSHPKNWKAHGVNSSP